MLFLQSHGDCANDSFLLMKGHTHEEIDSTYGNRYRFVDTHYKNIEHKS